MKYAQPSAPTRSIENHLRRLSSSRAIIGLSAALVAASGGSALAQPAAAPSRPRTQSASAEGETSPTSRARGIDIHTPSQAPVRNDGAPVVPRNSRPVMPVVAPSRIATPRNADAANDAVWEERAAEAIGWISLPDGFGGTPDHAVLVEATEAFGWAVPANLAGAKDDHQVPQEFGGAYPWSDIANVAF